MVSIRAVGRRISQFFKKAKPSSGNNVITFFEVKDLYNRAYEEKAQARNALRRYHRMVREAEALDEAYRTQLGLDTRKAA